MIKAIVIKTKPAWYCKGCNDSSHVLYMDGDKRYCEKCASNEIKQQAKYFNQNGEEIGYKDL